MVDAKVPLEAFLDAQETNDEHERTTRLQPHARQVRDHMDKLGSKAYWEHLGSSPKVVVMFLPGETLFSRAATRPVVDRARAQPRAAGQPDHANCAADHRGPHVAAEGAGRQLPRSRAARQGVSTARASPTFSTTSQETGRGGRGRYGAPVLQKAACSSARDALRVLGVTAPGPALDPIDTVPRVLKQLGLMGLPEDATADEGSIPIPSERAVE